MPSPDAAARSDDPTVAIIGGSGQLGRGLTLRLARAGVRLVIGSRSIDTATEAVERIRAVVPEADVAGRMNPDAVAEADVIVLCVPFAHHTSTIASVKDSLRSGQLVVDAVVPLATATGGKPTRLVGVWDGSAAEQTCALVPDGVGVVSALHTISGAALADLSQQLGEDVLVCGDVRADKQRAIALLERIDGLRGVDCGRLDRARLVEPLTALLIGINIRYKTHAGIRITGLPS